MQRFSYLIACSIVIGSAILLVLLRHHVGRAEMVRASISNIKSIGRALHSYHDVHGAFPPAIVCDDDGIPLHGWRGLILPFLESGEYADRLGLLSSLPWDDDANHSLIMSRPEVYCGKNANSSETLYVAVDGPGLFFDAQNVRTLAGMPKDGQDTIAIIELDNTSIEWARPGDIREEDFLRRFSQRNVGPHSSGFVALFVDGSARLIPYETPIEAIREMLRFPGDASPRDQ